MDSLTFKTISTRSELEEIGRLRYQAFIVERGCSLPEADHVNGLLIDQLDEEILLKGAKVGWIVAAMLAGEIVGTARASLFGEATSHYETMYRCDEFDLRPSDRPTITSRLCTSAEKRHSSVSLALIKEVYRFGVMQGARINFIDCNTPLLGLFKRFGFQESVPALQHSAFGHIHPLVLILNDKDHLQAVRSPFLSFQHAVHSDPLALSRLRLSLKRVQHTYSTLIQSPIYYEHNQ